MYPKFYDFDFVKEIRKDKNIILVVDDSHGIGVINNNGMGAIVDFPKQENIENVVVASMAKALGVDAGIVLASNKIINKLKSTNTFIGLLHQAPPHFMHLSMLKIYIERP